MQPIQPPQEMRASEWKLLFIYNMYRLGCILLFYAILIYEGNALLWTVNSIYLLMALSCFYFRHIQKPTFQTQVFIAGSLDAVLQSTMILLLEGSGTWLGILLIFTIAALSILVPGRLAVFFASVATCILLVSSIWSYVVGASSGMTHIFYAGVHGAAIFATAITALLLAHRVRLSEQLAARRSRELAMMQQINKHIVERLQSGVISIDEHCGIQFINDAARELFNLSRRKTPATLAHFSLELDKTSKRFLRELNSKMRPDKVTLKSPSALTAHFLPTRVGSELMVLILIDDLAALSQQAQQMKLASLGRFSASIAHELRNPLGVIAHAAQLMGENTEAADEEQRLKELILRNCNRMNGIIKNVLQLSRRQRAQQEKINLGDFLQTFKAEYSNYLSCKITLRLPRTMPLTLHFDPSQLEQILVILCENAMAHGKNKQGEAVVTLKASRHKNRTQIVFMDEGRGINKDQEEAVFEPFFSTDRSGNGMGLFIARDLCEINHAKLTLKSAQKGACFVITTQQISEIDYE